MDIKKKVTVTLLFKEEVTDEVVENELYEILYNGGIFSEESINAHSLTVEVEEE